MSIIAKLVGGEGDGKLIALPKPWLDLRIPAPLPPVSISDPGDVMFRNLSYMRRRYPVCGLGVCIYVYDYVRGQ